MKEPVDHIVRPSLPWRRDDASITECGYSAVSVKAISRPEHFQRIKDYGKQRAAMLTCMTCADTAGRWGTWEDDPRLALSREITWEQGGFYQARNDRGERLKDELLAIAALVDAHRDEFDASVSEIAQRREWLAKKAALDQKKPPQQRRL
jgi:hypothetical protein